MSKRTSIYSHLAIMTLTAFNRFAPTIAFTVPLMDRRISNDRFLPRSKLCKRPIFPPLSQCHTKRGDGSRYVASGSRRSASYSHIATETVTRSCSFAAPWYTSPSFLLREPFY